MGCAELHELLKVVFRCMSSMSCDEKLATVGEQKIMKLHLVLWSVSDHQLSNILTLFDIKRS